MTGPLVHSEVLGRVIRQDGIATLGTSTQTLVGQALDDGDWELAGELVSYFWEEMWRIGEALFCWLEDIVDFQLERSGGVAGGAGLGSVLTGGLAAFDPASGDRDRALRACAAGDRTQAREATELMRVRWAALHDAYVAWIQDLIGGIADRHGEPAVLESLTRTYDLLWARRYEAWDSMAPIERLQLSVEGMRGHLSGRGRRGDVGILEEADRFVMILDPCGSCGVLRRGDPESGRPPANPAGTQEEHPWAWSRRGVGWYAVHSAIVMEYLPVQAGLTPLRPMLGCDRDGPCRWYVYKDRAASRILESND
jgi:hypothetical protein